MQFNIYDDPISKQPTIPEKQESKVDPLLSIEAVHPKQDVSNEEQKKKQNQSPFKEQNKDHFKELADAVEVIHKILIEKNVPYRFCVYREQDEIMIDIVKLNSLGKIIKTIKRNITHEDFYKWIEHIENQDGLVFDESM